MQVDLVEIRPTYHGTYNELISDKAALVISIDEFHQVYFKFSKRCAGSMTSLSIAKELPRKFEMSYEGEPT